MQVKIDQLTKAYGMPMFGQTIALDNVFLEFPGAELVAIVGANGAGKTTLLESLVGIVASTSGAVFLDGERFSRSRIDLRRRIAYLPDVPLFFANTTVLKHISLYVACYEADRVGLDAEIVNWLQEFALLPKIDHQVRTLSRGERYKAALIALLAVNAELWLIDEPFASGMDPEGLLAFRKAARMAVERGVTVIYSTQILEVAERFSDRVCILQSGRVRTFDSIERLRDQHGIHGGDLEAIYRRISETPQ
ncbi:MAG: ABC transporter ATP-binding protein [Planctomycetales bacterium]|nr:ABC transporter ATP-binding protein [Planctomycetales bacterium]